MYFLHRELKGVSRKRQVMGYDDAMHIGILFDASSEESWKLSAKFIKELEAAGKKVTAMGYVCRKKPGPYVIEQLNTSFFQRKDFTWDMKRRNTRLKEFEVTPFDILIDLSPGDMFLTKYITGVSRAIYKVGVFNDSDVDLFDLMIRLPEPFRLQELMQQIVYYLKMIKKPVINVG